MDRMRNGFSKAYWLILIFLLVSSIYTTSAEYTPDMLTNNETMSSFCHPDVFHLFRDPPRKDNRSFVVLRMAGLWFIATYFSALIIKPKTVIFRFTLNSIGIEKLKKNLIPRYHNSMYESDYPYFLI